MFVYLFLYTICIILLTLYVCKRTDERFRISSTAGPTLCDYTGYCIRTPNSSPAPSPPPSWSDDV